MPSSHSTLSPSPPPELLTDKQVSGLLGVCLSIVWRLARQGELLPVRIGRCTRWRRADVQRYIDSLPIRESEVAHAR